MLLNSGGKGRGLDYTEQIVFYHLLIQFRRFVYIS